MTAAFTRHSAVPRPVAATADDQCDVVTRAQLARFGIDRARIRAAVDARRWQAFGKRAVVLHNSELTEAQRRWVAVLLLEQPVALAGITAACAAGLQGFDDNRVHIVVDRACGAALPSWVKLHNSRRFTAADISPGTALPRTRLPRSLIDAGAWGSSARRACALLCAGVQQRLVLPSTLATALHDAGHVRHVAIMRAVLGDISGGGHTLAEIDLAPLARRAGLPPPSRQVLRRERGGKVRYVDAAFDLPDGRSFLVEIDGAVHLRALSWWDDLHRQNELLIAGERLLRFDSVTLRLDPARVVGQLARMGGRPTVLTCDR